MIDLTRSEILIGTENLNKLLQSTVAVFGLGGVGGYAAEAIARAGVGTMIIADYDCVTPSNINRQILSLSSTMGELKTEAAMKRLKDINPEMNVVTISERLTPENISRLIPKDEYLYAIDAIDEIDSKTSLIAELVKKNIPFVSSMGAGSRLDSSKIKVDDISRTEYCPLARVMRKRLKAAGIETGVRCIYSTENLNKVREPETGTGKRMQGSISFMPGIFGLMAAGLIINDIINRI
ncbi:MAG TPA: tRNA threonylcarbamoyladenosine dehydratase [Spirochaetota bacterium]|nr:tRNA threonylcarbamoyladenosine dehydratase [Spirochaetota bacterium]HPS86076.1 tRNA threonylcarbamoyladenosine dehydratase [Spirochaetota bacterium]